MEKRIKKGSYILRKMYDSMLIMMLFFIITMVAMPNSYESLAAVDNTNEENGTKTEQTYEIENVFHRDYWQWHTRKTTNDKAYNGEHIQINENAITFYGYGQTSYKDFLYKEFPYAGKKIFKIKIDENEASYHTLEGAGFLINANIKDNKISGYVLLYEEKVINIYRIEGLDITEFETKANAKVSTYGELVKSMPKIASGIHNVVVETTPTLIKVTDNSNTMELNLDSAKHAGESFGLISSYVQHDCQILSKIIFEEFELEIENYEIPVITSTKEDRPISGASYQVEDQNGKVVRTGSSDAKGIYNMVGLPEGTYTIRQTSVPSSYRLNTTQYTFKVTKEGKAVSTTIGEEIKIKFVNELIPTQKNVINGKLTNSNDNEKKEIQKTNKTTTTNNQSAKSNEKGLPTKIPQTGDNSIIPIVLIALCSISIYFAIQIKRYHSK